METKIINIKSGEPYDVYCGRANATYNLEESVLANPFPITKERSREQAIEEYKVYFYDRIEKDVKFKEYVESLLGKTLACWCVPQKCHVEVIKKYLDTYKLHTQIFQEKSKKYKIAVIGSRTVTNPKIVYEYLDTKYDKIEMIISGGCSGPDSFGQQWAQDNGFPCLIYYPRWHNKEGEYNKGAGFQRNYLIVKDSDIVIAFFDGISKGTQNSIDLANKLGKKVIIHKVEPNKNNTL